ncbi:MAG: TauD/TfdA family dioxygenase [Pseudomonadota bacterium]
MGAGLDIRSLDAPFGAAVHGLDLNRTPDAPDVIDTLVDALHEHRMLVIKRQSLAIENYVTFGRQIGEPIIHVVKAIRMEACPEVAVVGNVGDRQKSDPLRLAASFWHTDQAYEDEPASATMLYCVEAPEEGGQTMLTDTIAAYDALDEHMKARLEGLVVRHSYGAASGRDGEYDARGSLTEKQRNHVVPVYHPLVLRHPATGRRSLYAVAGTPEGIEGMADDDSQALLRELKQHVLKPDFRYDHTYEVGDLAIWDTFATMHSAVPIAHASADPRNTRLLWRISCRGAPAPYRPDAAHAGAVPRKGDWNLDAAHPGG